MRAFESSPSAEPSDDEREEAARRKLVTAARRDTKAAARGPASAAPAAQAPEAVPAATHAPSPAPSTCAPSVVVVAAPRAPPRPPTALPPPDADRKRFMSGKAADVHDERRVAGRRPAAKAAATSAAPPSTNLRDLAREVETLGAAALDKRARKALEERRLTELGCAPAPRPAVPARIGFGSARHQKARSAAALEAAIDAGLVSRKGLGKKKRREKEAARREGGDGGLREHGAAFRGGVLRVAAPGVGKSGGRGRGRGRGGGRGRGRGRGR